MLNHWDYDPAMFPCVEVPDLIPFDWTVARCPGALTMKTSRRGVFLQAALPPSCCLTGKTAGHRPSGGAPFVQVEPFVLTSRRGERRSFWGVGPQGSAVGVLRHKARWPSDNCPTRRFVCAHLHSAGCQGMPALPIPPLVVVIRLREVQVDVQNRPR